MLDQTPRWSGGTDIALAWPGGVALVAGRVGLDVAERLWTRVRAESKLGTFLKTLAAASDSGFLDLPDFAVAVSDGSRWQVAVRGAVELEIVSAMGSEVLSGEGVTTWAEKSVEDPRGLRLRMAPSSKDEGPLVDGVGQASAIQVGESVPLVDGVPEDEPRAEASPFAPAAPIVAMPSVVPSAPVVVEPAGPILGDESPIAAPEDQPEADGGASATLAEEDELEDVESEEVEEAVIEDPQPGESQQEPEDDNPYRGLWDRSIAVDVESAAIRGTDGEGHPGASEPAPPEGNQMEGATVFDPAAAEVEVLLPGTASSAQQVLSKSCDRGHANPPDRAVCFVCDAPVSGAAILAPRPQLGWLRVEGGETVPLTGPVIAGRNPSSTALRSVEAPRLLALPYPHVSSTHLAVKIEGWRVLVQDLRSSNGTYLRRHGKPPVRLPETPYLLVPGDLIDLGKGLFIHLDRIP